MSLNLGLEGLFDFFRKENIYVKRSDGNTCLCTNVFIKKGTVIAKVPFTVTSVHNEQWDDYEPVLRFGNSKWKFLTMSNHFWNVLVGPAKKYQKLTQEMLKSGNIPSGYEMVVTAFQDIKKGDELITNPRMVQGLVPFD